MSALSVTAVHPLNITISWPDLTDTTLNGGDLPIYYQVEWYSGGIWEILSTESMGKYLSFTHTRTPSTNIFPSGSNQ